MGVVDLASGNLFPTRYSDKYKPCPVLVVGEFLNTTTTKEHESLTTNIITNLFISVAPKSMFTTKALAYQPSSFPTASSPSQIPSGSTTIGTKFSLLSQVRGPTSCNSVLFSADSDRQYALVMDSITKQLGFSVPWFSPLFLGLYFGLAQTLLIRTSLLRLSAAVVRFCSTKIPSALCCQGVVR